MAEKSADRKFCDNRDYGNIHIKLAFGLFIASVAIQGIDSPMAPQYFDLTGFDPHLDPTRIYRFLRGYLDEQ